MMRFSGIYAVILLIITFSFVHGDPKVPCYFIFGDSLSDPGNNNRLITAAKGNYAPYGVDFPGGVATGRFTNGLTIVDVLTQLLGIQGFIPPITGAFGAQMLKGVNYASAAGGILPGAGATVGDRIWLARQVRDHGATVTELQPFVKGQVSDYLKKCLYTVNIGTTDYLYQFFISKSISNPDQFATTLIANYEQQLEVLYGYGARKIALFGLGLIGCIPFEFQQNKPPGCVTEINDAVMPFNQKLKQLVDSLNAKLPGAKFTFIDSVAVRAAAPLPPGINSVGTCCKVSSVYACEPFVPPCPDRTRYEYMDGFHPTQVVNEAIARSAFISPNPLFVHPVDINDLVSSS